MGPTQAPPAAAADAVGMMGAQAKGQGARQRQERAASDEEESEAPRCEARGLGPRSASHIYAMQLAIWI